MQIHSLEDEDLRRKLGRVWGVVRDSPEELNKRKEELKLELNITSLAKADLANGRRLYEQRCSSCHVLYGKEVNWVRI